MSDDAQRPRCVSGQRGHLNVEEVMFVREGFENFRPAAEVARDLSVSKYTVRRRYRRLQERAEKEAWA